MKTTPRVPKANVLGVGVGAINLVQATQLILEAVRQNRKGYLAVTGVHGVCGTHSPPFRPLNHEEEADLVRKTESLRPDLEKIIQ